MIYNPSPTNDFNLKAFSRLALFSTLPRLRHDHKNNLDFRGKGPAPKRNDFLKEITLPKDKNLFCLINIRRTKNNTHALISSLFGKNKTKWSISAGCFKLPGGRRKTRFAQRTVYKSCLEKALSYGYKYAIIHCKGTRGSKVRTFQFFGNNLRILMIKDTTGSIHNGCRPPKQRRV